MEKPFRFSFPNGLTAHAIRIAASVELSVALCKMELHSPRPILGLGGGASKLSEPNLARLRSLFVEILAPLVETLGVTVVDGGTDAGVMQLMGLARAETGATFPLIGVAPASKVALPDEILSFPNRIVLEPHHTHFVLVPGSNWGDESPWLVRVASVVAGRAPSVTLLINGGEIAWKDVSENIKVGRPVITLMGSGRTADTLALALRGEASEERAREIAASGLIQAIDPTEDSDALARVIKKIFTAKE